MTEYEKSEREPRLPYGGLFGDSNLIKVIEQVIADPDIEYRPIDLEKLTKESTPTVRASLKILTSQGLLDKDETDRQHPVYRVNTDSKRYVALTFLAYAVLDDKNGTDSMKKIIVNYYESMHGDEEESNKTVCDNDPELAISERSMTSVDPGTTDASYILGLEGTYSERDAKRVHQGVKG